MADDLLLKQSRWDELHRKSLKEKLSQEELQEAIELTRLLRQTNTGPARKRKAAANKGPISDDQLAALLKG